MTRMITIAGTLVAVTALSACEPQDGQPNSGADVLEQVDDDSAVATTATPVGS